MARRKQAPTPPLRSASLESLAPLKLHAGDVALVGVVRAAVDAVHSLPVYTASFEAARATRDKEARAAHVAAASALIRRTAEAHAKHGASLVHPEALPPF